ASSSSSPVPGPPNAGKISGDSPSNLPAIIGAIVGVIALLCLLGLVFYRRRQKRLAGEEYAFANDNYPDGAPRDMTEEGPRTAFRHESFMALVKDAAKGFYAPTVETDPLAGPNRAGPSTTTAAAAGAAGGAYTAVNNGPDSSLNGSRHSGSTERSLQYLDIGGTSPGARAHAQPLRNSP
ncbi:hypothetical protein BGX27_005289, partial [Mortierella sp. AM989]